MKTLYISVDNDKVITRDSDGKIIVEDQLIKMLKESSIQSGAFPIQIPE